jgi:hypothetical protein
MPSPHFEIRPVRSSSPDWPSDREAVQNGHLGWRCSRTLGGWWCADSLERLPLEGVLSGLIS